MRILYSAFFYLLIPLIIGRLVWRGFKAPDYWLRWPERFAIYSAQSRKQVIWFHAVSFGEAESLFPLVNLLKKTYPQANVLVTTTTPTGSARVKAILGDTVDHVYLPYDLPGAVKRFISHFKPRVAVIMETEIWPNLFHQCGINSIPLYIVNARISENSVKGYQKLAVLVRATMANVRLIATQSREDLQRFVSIGANKDNIEVAGNIKFDLEISTQILKQGKDFRQAMFPERRVIIVASTHRGEDEIFIELYQALKKSYKDLLLVLVPRHPERFTEVKKIVSASGLEVIMRSAIQACSPEIDVFIADTMGELKMFYAASDIAFVGGSMVPVGGHNVLEPAAIGTPVVFGPFMANFEEITAGLLAANAAIQCNDPKKLLDTFSCLLGNENARLQLTEQGKAFVKNNQGALRRVFAMLEPSLY